MKHLSISLAAIMLLFALPGNSSGNGSVTVSSTHHWTPFVRPVSQSLLYFWYTAPDDVFNDHRTLNDEINEMWDYYAVMIDTSPGGGVLVDRGYLDKSYPHDIFPSVYLYAHF